MPYQILNLVRVAAIVSLCIRGAGAQTQPDLNPNRTTGFAADSNGNSFIAIAGQNKVYKLNSRGELSVYAGTGEPGFNGDNLAASGAQLNSPWGLYLDAPGNLYIADMANARVRKVDAGTGAITTVAGNGVAASAGDGDIATAAQLNTPLGLAADETGNLVIADAKGARVRIVAADSGLIATAPLDDGIDPLVAPYGIVKDVTGAIFASDAGNVYKLVAGKLRRAAPETVWLTKSGVFYAPALQQISFPSSALPMPLNADVEWAPASCPPPGSNPSPADCAASARLMVNLRRLPAKSTLEVKPFGISNAVAFWTLEKIQFTTLIGTGTVAPLDALLPMTISTVAGPVFLDVDIPLSAVRVRMTVSGTVQINWSAYPFSLSGDLFP